MAWQRWMESWNYPNDKFISYTSLFTFLFIFRPPCFNGTVSTQGIASHYNHYYNNYHYHHHYYYSFLFVFCFALLLLFFGGCCNLLLLFVLFCLIFVCVPSVPTIEWCPRTNIADLVSEPIIHSLTNFLQPIIFEVTAAGSLSHWNITRHSFAKYTNSNPVIEIVSQFSTVYTHKAHSPRNLRRLLLGTRTGYRQW